MTTENLAYAGFSALDRVRALGRLARTTSSPLAFGVREFAARAGRAASVRSPGTTYGVRGHTPIALRHGTADIRLAFDILIARQYEPPAQVRAALQDIPDASAVDLGGNIGLFTVYASRALGIDDWVVYEPDPTNLPLLRANMARLEVARPPRLVEACAGVRDGVVRFDTGNFLSSRVLGVDEVAEGTGDTELPVRDAIPDIVAADLVKVDIEGSEWDLLADERLDGLRARALFIEYHPWGCPGDEPAAVVTERLRGLGFTVQVLMEFPDGMGELWAWR
ncbi:MAG: FkbM family methyltransferase [Miltoncostaeaceae bacterium]